MFYFSILQYKCVLKLSWNPDILSKSTLTGQGEIIWGSNSPIEIDHITLHRRLPTPTLGRLALFSFSLSLSPFSSVSPLSFSESADVPKMSGI